MSALTSDIYGSVINFVAGRIHSHDPSTLVDSLYHCLTLKRRGKAVLVGMPFNGLVVGEA
jgi:hypothetical protein